MAFVDKTEFNSGASGVTSQATTLPTRSNGDVLVLAFCVNQTGTPTSVSVDGDWTATPDSPVVNTNSNRPYIYAYTRVVDGGESTPTITLVAARKLAGGIMSFSGVDNSTPVDDDHGTPNTASTNCTEATGVTVGSNSEDVIMVAGSQASGVTGTPPASPGTWSERIDQTTSGAFGASCEVASSVQDAGATGAVTTVISGSQVNTAYLLALKVASAPAATTAILTTMRGIVGP